MSENNTIQDEETVKQAEQVPAGEEVQQAFSIVKLEDGKVLVQAIEGLDSGSHDEIYATCNQVLRMLDAQYSAAVMQAAMMAAAKEAQENASGLVIPK